MIPYTRSNVKLKKNCVAYDKQIITKNGCPVPSALGPMWQAITKKLFQIFSYLYYFGEPGEV